jgi:hypothetical protein
MGTSKASDIRRRPTRPLSGTWRKKSGSGIFYFKGSGEIEKAEGLLARIMGLLADAKEPITPLRRQTFWRNLFVGSAFSGRLRPGSIGWPGASQRRTIMTKGMFALLLAGALVVPHVTPALGTDSTVGRKPRPRNQRAGTCSFRPFRISTPCAGWIPGCSARKSIP